MSHDTSDANPLMFAHRQSPLGQRVTEVGGEKHSEISSLGDERWTCRPAFVLSRSRHFGPQRATSVDLCTETLVADSRFRADSIVIGPHIDKPFKHLSFIGGSSIDWQSTRKRVPAIKRMLEEHGATVAVVQEHLPTAAQLASSWAGPVILQTHNYQAVDFTGGIIPTAARRWYRARRYIRLAGLTHVSAACQHHFQTAWPDITTQQTIVPNALMFDNWTPRVERSAKILCVGRASEEKGILLAAQGIATALRQHTDWCAEFILSEVHRFPEYINQVRQALLPLGTRGLIHIQRPFDYVKSAYEDAAIAIVPSKWNEPFGRTALEAHAGGACLISSGTGGLGSVSGPDGAYYLPETTPDAISRAVTELISAPALRHAVAIRGRSYASAHYDISVVAPKYDDWIAAIARAWHARSRNSAIANT